MQYPEHYDVIVVGGGHAGVEAALASARMGAKTLLATHNIETIGQMSCNPAIGGIGKGHIVKEIDALGGVMARAIDQAGIHFRILNSRKGPAVQATRAQADRALYRQAIRTFVEQQENLAIFQQEVVDLMLKQDRVIGIETQIGIRFYAEAVVLTAGTFLNGKIHIGLENAVGGRAGDPPSVRLAARLAELPVATGRLKTGTPPRIDGKTIDYSELEAQPGDDPVPVFSFFGRREDHPRQVHCHITHTNTKTHELIHHGLDQSPIYSGQIDSIGPRYCPSIEDKIVRFADKDSHQIFIEPEGLNTHEVYPNGISTSLPFSVQFDFVRSIKGFEQAVITRPGYAIEYDFFDPRGLKHTLETKTIQGLFFAGQINGTTGYEEAAGQGLIAGINAACRAQQKDSWYPLRNEAYIGVMIDDLVTLGTQEPYRMFTSRAEHRLILREDNADLRLTDKAITLGLVSEHFAQRYLEKKSAIADEWQWLESHWLNQNKHNEEIIQRVLGQSLKHELRLLDILRRPQIGYQDVLQLAPEHQGVEDTIVQQQLEIQAKYQGYIERQQAEIAKHQHFEYINIPSDFDYLKVQGLSAEVEQKLTQVRPETVAQAGRIPGVTPAAISLLLVHLKRNQSVDKSYNISKS